jgi:LytR cell envelope-related transcriptional attenuator
VSGRHEPGSRSSLYISVTTAVLRAGLVVAAVVLGVFVLTRAFPEDGTEAQTPATSPTEQQTTIPPVGTPTTSPGATQPPASPPVSLEGVTVQVLNGTNEDGLAAGTAQDLEGLGVKILGVGNAARTYPITTLFFRPSDSQPIAEALAQAKFPGAKLEPATNNLEPDVQVTVVVGQDYASQN